MTVVEQENTDSAFQFFASTFLESEDDFAGFVEAHGGPSLSPHYRFEDLSMMPEIIGRIRKQLYFIIHSIRCWRERHEGFDNPLRRRYSAYEGAMCYADLRRHWAYYRHAVREYKRALKTRV